MRYPSIDVLRSLAIVTMVIVHFVENLSGWYGTPGEGGPATSGVWRPTGLAAPLFTFLTGVSYRLWVRGREARGDSDDAITRSSVRRGLFLVGLGFVFNVLVWLPEDTFNWDVLTFIGASVLLLSACRDAPSGALLLAAAAAVAISPVLRERADYDSFWTHGYVDPGLTLGDVGLGFLCVGYFPVFPWIAFPLVGFVVAPVVFAARDGAASRWPIVAGGALVAVAATSVAVRAAGGEPPAWLRLQGWTMFPTTVEYVCGTLGTALLVLPAAHRLLDRGARQTVLARVAGTYSRHSLSIYLLHHAVHVWPLWIWGAATGADVTAHWQRAMPASASLVLAFLFVVCAYPLFHWLESTGRGGVEGWMRWLCD